MNLDGEILIFDNVYCAQFKNQFDILIVLDGQSILVKINNSSLEPERRQVKKEMDLTALTDTEAS